MESSRALEASVKHFTQENRHVREMSLRLSSRMSLVIATITTQTMVIKIDLIYSISSTINAQGKSTVPFQ